MGVKKVTAGYCGGTVEHPYYKLVCTGSTGTRGKRACPFTTVRAITYGQLLMVFFGVATTRRKKNRQGQISERSIARQFFIRRKSRRKLPRCISLSSTQRNSIRHAIVTQVVPAPVFYDAEDYHQDYLVHHPDDGYIRAMDMPKLELLKREFPQFYR